MKGKRNITLYGSAEITFFPYMPTYVVLAVGKLWKVALKRRNSVEDVSKQIIQDIFIFQDF